MNPVGIVVGIFMLLILCFFWSETFWSILIWLSQATLWVLLVFVALCLIFGKETGVVIGFWVFGIAGAILVIAGILIVASFVIDMTSNRPGYK
jgi:hypothetical protein